MNDWQGFSSLNAGQVAALYERYLQDPASIDPASRSIFDRWVPPTAADQSAPAPNASDLYCPKIVGAVGYMESIRKFGYMDAQLDPLGAPPPGDPSLRPESHGITEDDLRTLPASILGDPIADGKKSAYEVVRALREVYSSTIGYDYAHLRAPEQRRWLHEAAEARYFHPPADPIDPVALLDRLTEIEVFARFLIHTFPGKTIFSGEGLDMLIPVLDEVIGGAAEAGFRNILIGMAHRARVEVMAHVLHKPYDQILAGFKDPALGRDFREDLGWTGDVKYHAGARRALRGGPQVNLVISIPPNPSHLEAIDPVVSGMARAAGTSVNRPGPPRFDPTRTLPILIHGDASFSGQGVIAETFNLERLAGYTTGGIIHIIANNQLGYTTTPEEGRSTLFAGDLARGFKIPIVHVNADDVETCIQAARLAFEYRARFHRDFLIDLVGYRRHGHNEGDEPRFTQPLLYQKIERHPTVRELWARTLIRRGAVDADLPESLVRKHMEVLRAAWNSLRAEQVLIEPTPKHPPAGAARRTETALPVERLRELNRALLRVPEGFTVNTKLLRARERRRQALDDLDAKTILWATAEELALASILEDGVAVRLTGQDVERGTFNQRHCRIHDVLTDKTHTPLEALPQARAAFEVHNSPLTENAAVAFEYGYSLQEPSRLVLWEAQYGDFITGAQVIVDELLLSARAKWGLTPSLVLLLPHGFEGQGPDHSSGRLERFLQLASETNVRIVNCTTAAQYFHLLRMQATLLKIDPLPLVVMTPKSLLRHPFVASSLRELAEGGFRRVINDGRPGGDPRGVHRLILCSGKVCVDLAGSPHLEKSPEAALCRVEKLYPFPEAELQEILTSYAKLREVVWVQEEPANMGAWEFVRPLLGRLIKERWPFYYVGRDRSSSPAEGSFTRHARNQEVILEQACGPHLAAGQQDMVLIERI